MPSQRAILALLIAPSLAAAEGPRISGPPVTAFDWAAEQCTTWDIPDAPARAWRGRDGLVRMIAGSERSRGEAGRDLDHLERSCAPLHEGARADDPAAYDDRSWIAATHVDTSGRVVALAHVEYHGHLRSEACAADAYAACWRNAVVELRSDDSGRSFRRMTGPEDMVAALPYRYEAGQLRRSGYFNPSNIIERDGFLYVFVFAEGYGAQARGACLLRRPVDGEAKDWRAWSGAGFDIRFADPYREEIVDPTAHVCAPLAGISSTISSVAWHAGWGQFLAVTPATRPDAGGVLHTGIWWMTSEDLVVWSEPALLIDLPLLWRRDCAAPAAYAYPSLLDLNSPSVNFETLDSGFRLYLVRLAVGEECAVGPDRDLVWWPLSWPRPGQSAGTVP